MAIMNPRLIGRVKNTEGSPCEISSALRRFSSIIGPSTNPSSIGTGLHSSILHTNAEDAEERREVDVEGAVVHAVDADGGEHHDGGEEQAIGHLEQAHPEADQRQVEHDQHQVADPHARDQPPEEVGLLGHHLRAGRDAVDHERAEHQRHRPARGNPQREHRNELALRVRVVGGLGSRHALDRAVAETRRVLGHFLLDHVGRKRGDRRAGAGQHAEERPEPGSPEDRAEGLLQVLLRGEEVPHLGGEDLALLRVAEVADDFAHREHPHGDDHEADAVRQLVECRR